MFINKFSIKTKLILAFFLTIISFGAFSQTEQELLNLAKSKGISESQINEYKKKLGDNSQKKSTTSKIQSSEDKINERNPNLRKVTDPFYEDPFMEEDSLALDMDKKKTIEEDSLKIKIYGENLFKDKKLNFIPNLKIATPKNYILGPGDELLIEVFGNSFNSFNPEVSPEGTIKILNLNPIIVAGLDIETAKQKIISNLGKIYRGIGQPGSNTNCSISLGNIRTINIVVAGEVLNPGSYNVPSLTTAFNALYLSGGPNEVGSYREVNIIRNNQTIASIDLYEFLNSGRITGDRVLQDQDIVFVPTYKTRVEIEGEIKRQLKFELKSNESLQDLINYAGGFTDYAYKRFITGTRKSSRELEKLNIPEDQFENFLPKTGDLFTVDSILVRFSNQVTIEGPVYRPGVYAIDNRINSVRTLIENAEGIRDEAYLNRAVLKRNYDAFNKESISFNLGDLVKGKINDIPLRREDSLIIFDKTKLLEKEVILVFGEVNSPDTLDFYKNMTLSDAILLADGFNNSASFKNIEISRRRITHGMVNNLGKEVEIFNLSIDGNFSANDSSSNFKLEPYDVISVRRSPDYEEQENVVINGEVFYPGTYTLDKKENRISDIIKKSGGLKPEGYLGGAIIERNELIIGVNIEKVLENPNSKDNILLEDGDKIEIPKYNPLVEINGAVNNAVSINFDKSYNFKDYINFAGGFEENALKRRAYAIQVNGKSKSAGKIFLFNHFPKIKPGDKIYVPFSQENTGKLSTADVISLASTLSSLSLSIITLVRTIK